MVVSPEWSARTRRQEEMLPMRGAACVIEFNEITRDEVASSLRALGFTVHETACGTLGEFIAAQIHLKLLIVNLTLPDVKGLMLLRRLRRAHPTLTIIALTSDPMSALPMTLARFAGADAVLASPPSNEALCAALIECKGLSVPPNPSQPAARQARYGSASS